MKDFFTRIKGAYCISAILCIVLGVVLIVRGDVTLLLIGKLLGVIVMAIGAVNLAGFFLNGRRNGIAAAASAAAVLIGLWILFNPSVVASIVPIVIGVILIGHGVKECMVAAESKTYGYGKWGIGIVLSVVSILFGVFCIINAFGLMALTLKVIGVALIYNGISNLWVTSRTAKSEKDYRNGKEVIDVEFKE